MRTALMLMVVAVCCLPAAQACDGFLAAWSGTIGLYDMGDDGSGLGLGLRYGIPMESGTVLIGLGWGDGESVESEYNEVDTANGGLVKVGTDVWSLDASYVVPLNADDPDEVEDEDAVTWFYGGGIGMYRVDGPGWDDDSFGAHVLVGGIHDSQWFAELRYVFATDFDWGGGVSSDVDGLRLSIGRWFD